MKAAMKRREFLAGSGRLAAGLAAVALVRGAGAEEKKPPGLCLACRDGHLKATGKNDTWAALESIGAEGVEASIGEDLALAGLFHPDRKYSAAAPAGIEAVRRRG